MKHTLLFIFIILLTSNSFAQNYGFDGKMKCITVASRSLIWALSNDGRIWRWNGRAWEQSFPGYNFEQISVANDGTLWGINNQKNIFRYASGQWQRFQGELSYVASGSINNALGINQIGQVWHWNGFAWEQPVQTAPLKQLDVASDGTVWGVSVSDAVFRWTGYAWEQVPGSLKHITVGSASSIWGVNNKDEVFRFNGTTWEQPVRNARLRQLDIAADGTLWGINSANDIFMWDGSSWIYMTTTNAIASNGNGAPGLPSTSMNNSPGLPQYPARPSAQPYVDPGSPNQGMPADGIAVYRDSNFGGDSMPLNGNWIAGMNVDWNDQISSIHIPQGYKIQAFEHEDYSGSSRIFTSDWAGDYDFNDKISSIKILEGADRPKRNGGVSIVKQGTVTADPVQPVMQQEQKRARGRNRNTDYTPTPAKIYCSAPTAEYDRAINAIKSNSFSSGKMSTAKNALAGKCFSLDQIRGIIALFSFEDQKLSFVKYAYDFTDNKTEYYTLTDVFTFTSSKTNFNEFLKGK